MLLKQKRLIKTIWTISVILVTLSMVAFLLIPIL